MRLLIFTVMISAFSSCAQAATATFAQPTGVDAASAASISSDTDNAGVIVGLGESIGLLFDQPIGVSRSVNNSVSLFTLAPVTGNARATIRFGSYNGGTPLIAFSRNFRSGQQRNFNRLFQRGCSLFGGCDYIEITTTRTVRGAAGVEIDYVEVDGRLVAVAAPTPEPSTWALMIAAFSMIALRLKFLRQVRRRRQTTSLPGECALAIR